MRVFAFLVSLGMWLGGCGKSDSGKKPVIPDTAPQISDTETMPKAAPIFLTRATISRTELRQQLGNAFGAEVSLFRQALYNLSAALDKACSSFELYEQRQTQESWATAMEIWQRLEMMQIGPLAAKKGALRQEVYNWPKKVDRCSVDAQIVDISLRPRNFVLTKKPEKKGLQTLEYLLFEETLETSCVLQGSRRTSWNRLNERQKKGARCIYEKALVADLIRTTEKILDLWGPSDRHAFMSETDDEEEAAKQVQALFDNLFTLDGKVRPLKLAGPAGLSKELCTRAPEPCFEQEEFPLSQESSDAIRANIDGVRTLLLGPLVGRRYAGGFIALLRAEGGGSMADRLEDQIMNLSNLSHSTDKTLRELIADHYGEACELHDYDSWVCRMEKGMSEISSLLREEMAPVLLLKAPRIEQNP